jgi:hypothetical protein
MVKNQQKRKFAIWWVCITILTVSSYPIVALSYDHSPESLQGLHGIYVVVEDIQPELEKLEITHNQIKTDAGIKLQQAGIKILTEEENGNPTGAPFLYINVNSFFPPENPTVFAVHISTQLRQQVRLARDPIIVVTGITWNVGATGFGGVQNIEGIRRCIDAQLDEFIKDYLGANPKLPIPK